MPEVTHVMRKSLLSYLYLNYFIWRMLFQVTWISTCISFLGRLVGDGSHSLLLCSLVHVLDGLFPPLVHMIRAFHGSFSSSYFGKPYLLFVFSFVSAWQIVSCGFYFAEQERWKKLVILWRFFFFLRFSIISRSSSCLW